jgi:hypothetical protein
MKTSNQDSDQWVIQRTDGSGRFVAAHKLDSWYNTDINLAQRYTTEEKGRSSTFLRSGEKWVKVSDLISKPATTEISQACSYSYPEQRTEQDAFSWVLNRGSMSSTALYPSMEYLVALRKYIYEWARRVDQEIYLLSRKQEAEDRLRQEILDEELGE